MKAQRWYTVKDRTVYVHDEPTVEQSKSMTIIDIDKDGAYAEQLKYYRSTFYLRRAWANV